MVVPSTPCWPRTSVAALSSLRRDSRLRSCWGSSALLTLVMGSFIPAAGQPAESVSRLQPRGRGLDNPRYVNVNSHLLYDEVNFMAIAAASTITVPAPSHPLRSRHFRFWWIGASISLLGDQFYLVALPWVVLQLTGSGLAMGTVAIAAGIPRAVLI